MRLNGTQPVVGLLRGVYAPFGVMYCDCSCVRVAQARVLRSSSFARLVLAAQMNQYTKQHFLTTCAAGGSAAWDRAAITSEHVDLARELLDQGADPTRRDRRGRLPLHYAARGIGDASVDMVALLLAAHGDVRDVHPGGGRQSPLSLAIRGLEEEYADPPRYLNCRKIARLLVRAGAPLYELTINQVATLATNTRTFATQEHLFATTRLIYDVAAAGSPQAYRIASRKKVLLLRSLALKGRAEPRDARMTFLVDSPNEIA